MPSGITVFCLNLPSPVEKDFEVAVAQPVKQLQKSRKALSNKKKGE